MAKKKKRAAGARQDKVTLSEPHRPLGTGILWSTAAAGLLVFLLFLAMPWVNVQGASKSALTLVGEAFANRSWFVAGSLLFLLVPALLAIGLAFLPPRLWMRDLFATATALSGGFALLVANILTRSTRNLLVFGSGRQSAEAGVAAIYFGLLAVTVGALAWLVRFDTQVQRRSEQFEWFGAFVFILLLVLFFNYQVIPHSIVPPPEVIRQRLGW